MSHPPGPRVEFVRGGTPSDPAVERAILLALERSGAGPADASDAWWWAGASAAVTGRAPRSPSELPDRPRGG